MTGIITPGATYAKGIIEKLKQEGFRVDADLQSEKIGHKVREAELAKIPYLFVIGDKEVESNRVSVRTRGRKDLGSQDLGEIIARLKRDIAEKC